MNPTLLLALPYFVLGLIAMIYGTILINKPSKKLIYFQILLLFGVGLVLIGLVLIELAAAD